MALMTALSHDMIYRACYPCISPGSTIPLRQKALRPVEPPLPKIPHPRVMTCNSGRCDHWRYLERGLCIRRRTNTHREQCDTRKRDDSPLIGCGSPGTIEYTKTMDLVQFVLGLNCIRVACKSERVAFDEPTPQGSTRPVVLQRRNQGPELCTDSVSL